MFFEQGKTTSLLCAALAWQLSEIFSDENIDIFLNKKINLRPKKKARIDDADLDGHIVNLLLSVQSSDSDDSEGDKKIKRKIYFCSRTHSQLTQVMSELKKIVKGSEDDVGEYSAITIGSRANLCINKEVYRLHSMQSINEKCLNLQSEDGKCCPYYNEDKEPSMKLLEESIKRISVADIEDMHELGSKINACPYYSARNVQQDADLVTLPYNALLHQETRNSLGIDLEGSIVIIDEAHNLIDTINQMYSVTVRASDIEAVQGALGQYFDRFNKRLAPNNSLLIQQMINCLSQLTAYTLEVKSSSIVRINDFLHDSRIDNINVFPIQAYALKNHLSQKLSSYYSTKEGEQLYLLNSILDFLVKLANADGDGRVHVQIDTDSISLKYISLNPEGFFGDVLEKAYSVILAGGTMSPSSDFIDQLFGMTLERSRILEFSCGHLIPKENCLAIPLLSGPTDQPFELTYNERSSKVLVQELGQTIINMIRIAPEGVVCFFPSYSYLSLVMEEWEQSDVLKSIQATKSLIVESQSLSNIEHLMTSYKEVARKGAVLFGVMGGRLSEGINFSDGLARLLIVVGLPFPNQHDPETAERINHYIRKKELMASDLNRSNVQSEYLENMCMRTVNQTLGASLTD